MHLMYALLGYDTFQRTGRLRPDPKIEFAAVLAKAAARDMRPNPDTLFDSLTVNRLAPALRDVAPKREQQ
jgi:hypothetical protein